MNTYKRVHDPFDDIDPSVIIWTDERCIRVEDISSIDISTIEERSIGVYTKFRSEPFLVTGFAALELVWKLKPGVLEGKRFVWPKHGWAVHNLFAHPAMQLLAFCHCYKLAMWIHDVTIPKPTGFK